MKIKRFALQAFCVLCLFAYFMQIICILALSECRTVYLLSIIVWNKNHKKCWRRNGRFSVLVCVELLLMKKIVDKNGAGESSRMHA